MEEETESNGFDLSSFLSSGLNLYSNYQAGKNTVDQAKLQQQIAAQNAAASAQNQNQLKQILIWGGSIIAGIIVLVIVVKAFKK